MPELQRSPASQVFEDAMAYNQAHGHENRGFLSDSRGFLPASDPLLALPASHRAWDEAAAQLPDLFRALKVRSYLDQLPLLPADSQALDDHSLLRASSLISILAHAYVRVEASPIKALPQAIQQPWEILSRRLERPGPLLHYIDLILYNWRRRLSAGPLILDNLDLLFPTIGNPEERIFYLTQVEIAAASAPALRAVLTAQDAVLRGDDNALEQALLEIISLFQRVSEQIVYQIDPNPHSRTYVDQVVWAKTVAPFAVPLAPGTPGPSGTAAPIFHFIDAFLGRPSYDAALGHEAAKLAALSPRHWRELIAAVSQVSVRSSILASGSSHLKGLFNALLETYAGDKGYLGVHRLKAYGFLEIAFKVGRSVTIGGFKGLFQDKTWNQIDRELALTRNERFTGIESRLGQAMPAAGTVAVSAGQRALSFITLEAASQGIVYQPGDRIAIWPENSPNLVAQTLAVLGASGDELLPLTNRWANDLRLRDFHRHDQPVIHLKDMLRVARIRPVSRELAKALLAVTANSQLKQIIAARMEDQWEVWDLLNLLAQGNFDPRTLWKAQPWEAHFIGRLLLPEQPRLYSLASAPNPAGHLQLFVTQLTYDSVEGPHSTERRRQGVASSFIRRMTTDEDQRHRLAFRIVPALRFHLPEDSQRPIVMFAAGSGIAPFTGFLEQRLSNPAGAENWLFFSTRSEEELYQRQQLEEFARRGPLQLRIVLTRQDRQMRFNGEKLVAEAGLRSRIDDAIAAEAQHLWQMVCSRQKSGSEGFFYICGRTHFASTVVRGLRQIIRQHTENEAQATDLFYRLVAERRLLLDVFTTYTGAASQIGRAFHVSEVVLHNNEANGYWLVLNGRVHDLSEFVHLHAGGKRILANNAGIDASRAYQSVQHHVHPEVDALLGMYEIGMMQRLDFGSRWAVGIGPQGLFYFTLEEAFVAWTRYIYLVTEMENAIANDFSFWQRSITPGELDGTLNPLTAHLLAEAHRRFLAVYLDGVLGEDLQVLWAITLGICRSDEHVLQLRQELDRAARQPDAIAVRQSPDVLQSLVDAWKNEPDPEASPLVAIVRQIAARISDEDLRCFSELKVTLRRGIQVFEREQATVAERGGAELLDVLHAVVRVVTHYYKCLAESAHALGPIVPTRAEQVQAALLLASGHGAGWQITPPQEEEEF